MAMSLIWPTWVGQRTIPINIAVRMHSVTLLCLLERCFPKSSEQFAVLAVGMHGVTLSCMLASGFFFLKIVSNFMVMSLMWPTWTEERTRPIKSVGRMPHCILRVLFQNAVDFLVVVFNKMHDVALRCALGWDFPRTGGQLLVLVSNVASLGRETHRTKQERRLNAWRNPSRSSASHFPRCARYFQVLVFNMAYFVRRAHQTSQERR